MAIQTSTVNTTDTTIFLSGGNNALTFISLCNYSANTVLVSLHIVPNGSSPGDNNLLIKDIEIVAGDTFIAYEGGEKIILGDGDYLSGQSNTASAITAITSYVTIG